MSEQRIVVEHDAKALLAAIHSYFHQGQLPPYDIPGGSSTADVTPPWRPNPPPQWWDPKPEPPRTLQ